MTRLLYIGGYGHSGSTLLECLIASSPAVLACGEVASCVRERDSKQKRCTCGHKAGHCPVWSFFYSETSRTVSGDHIALLLALMQRVDGRYAALIDSSKTAWGSITAPFRLKRKFGRDFILLHLTREPAAVCWSVLKQKNRRAYRGELTHYTLRCSWIVLGWSIANFSCDLFGMLYPQQYVRLRYEDLARSPTEILGKLFARLMPDVQWDSEEVAGDNRHQLYGNKVRHRAIGIEDVKEDIKWKAEMPPEYSRIVQPLSYLLRLRYGYS